MTLSHNICCRGYARGYCREIAFTYSVTSDVYRVKYTNRGRQKELHISGSTIAYRNPVEAQTSRTELFGKAVKRRPGQWGPWYTSAAGVLATPPATHWNQDPKGRGKQVNPEFRLRLGTITLLLFGIWRYIVTFLGRYVSGNSVEYWVWWGQEVAPKGRLS